MTSIAVAGLRVTVDDPFHVPVAYTVHAAFSDEESVTVAPEIEVDKFCHKDITSEVSLICFAEVNTTL